MSYTHVDDHDNWQAARCEDEVPGTLHDAPGASQGTRPISDELGGALFIVAHEREDGVDVICGSGEIDISTVAPLRDALRHVVGHAAGPIVVDLSQVSFMDSTGIHVLSATARQLTAQQRSLALACCEGGAVHRVLSLVGLLGTLSVHPSRQDAVAAAKLEPHRLSERGHSSVAPELPVQRPPSAVAVAQPDARSQWAGGHIQQAAISAEAVRIYKERIGRGPTRTRTYWAAADTVVIVLEQTLTVAERRMRALDEHQRLRELRTLLQADGRSDFCDSIERITGRKVRALISGIDTVADVATEIFVLHPPVTTADET